MIKSIFSFILLTFIFGNVSTLSAQTPNFILQNVKHQIAQLDSSRAVLENDYNLASYEAIRYNLKQYGLPSETYLEHKAYIFEYSEEHEQAKWVSHIITPDIAGQGFRRTDDFRVDSLVTTGSAEQNDYFNYYPNRRQKEQFEGFGYDRGHLAPSADFRWSREAVSESYFYSNMSPQHADFNRKIWADLEGVFRKYVISNNVSLAVVTAPVLTDNLPKITQSPNGVSIPSQFIKVAYDAENQRSIAFIMDNKSLDNPPSYYALSVDELEEITGYDYFSSIDEAVEASYDEEAWFQNIRDGNATPIKQHSLPRMHFNTTTGIKQAKSNNVVTVCGTVVDTRFSRKGHAWLNLDEKYPNQIFSIMIRKEELVNYPFDPVIEYTDQELCFEGKVEKWGDLIVMQVKKPELVTELK
ncbi:MAG: endonuclease G [Saprospiraceae bacterium]|jgi:endonuclease G